MALNHIFPALDTPNVFTGQNIFPALSTNINGEINVKAVPYNAQGDFSTDDTVALNAAMTAARATGCRVYIPAGNYVVSGTIDMRGLYVYGAGKYLSTLRLKAGVQASVLYMSLNTTVRGVGAIGSWDGHSVGLAGYGVEVTTSEPGSVSQLPYHMTLDDIYVGNTNSSGFYLPDAAYTMVINCEAHAIGGRAIMDIESHDDSLSPVVTGFGPTTITLIHNTFSDSAGAAIRINDGVNIRVAYNICENTAGFVVVGPQNRALTFEGNYQEGTTTNQFLTLAGSGGIGLHVAGNRGGPMGGPGDADVAGWQEIEIRPNWFAGPSWGDSGYPTTVRATSQFFDPLRVAPNEYVINPGGQTILTPAIYTPGASWSAILRGTFVDFTGGVAAMPPLSIVTSNAPSMAVGHTTLTFSMSANGQLQATVSAYGFGATTARFLGWIEVYSDRNHVGPSFAMQTPAPILTGGMRSNGQVSTATLAVDNGFSGTFSNGTQTMTITNGIVTSVA